MPSKKLRTIPELAAAIAELVDLVGFVATDHSVRERKNAQVLMDELRVRGRVPTSAWAAIDLPTGRSEELKLLVLQKDCLPRRFNAEHSRKGDAPARQFNAGVDILGEALCVLDDLLVAMEFELPLIIPRWAFDQVIGDWLATMQLSASMVLSTQRTVLVVDGDLMVRVSKMMSDPRLQMVSLREQTVRNLQGEPTGRRPNFTLRR